VQTAGQRAGFFCARAEYFPLDRFTAFLLGILTAIAPKTVKPFDNRLFAT
jgi:hypothetical protein